MTPETTVFLLTLILGIVHFAIGASFRVLEVSPMQLLGSRDDLPPIQNRFGERGERANNNFKETLPWALGLLILVQVTEQSNNLSALGAWAYLISRTIYLPLYVFGVPVLRSVAFVGAMTGLGLIALQIAW